MNVLIVGGGGREHALAWKCAQSDRVKTVYVAPGNAGTAREPGLQNVNISAEDIDGLIRFARDNHVQLTIVGPEGPLVDGIVDSFTQAGLNCFGPSRAAAQLEGSKAFTKDFLFRHHIPTAGYEVFTDVEAAETYIDKHKVPVVIKADGLAAGKGVIIAQTKDKARVAVQDMLSGNRFGEAGHRVVIEDFLEGEEASFIVMSDGEHILSMATSQDHKARDEGDCGPNTGGMGAYSPAPVVTPELHEKIIQTVIFPTIAGMKSDGIPYTGFLYAGLMISPQGDIQVLEYNCRFGDPETQPIMMRLQSDLVGLCESALQGRLNECNVAWDYRTALGIVAAAEGYPDSPRKGDEIHGLDKPENSDVQVFHAGTRDDNGKIFTAGGRVLCVTALGDNVTAAQKAACLAISQISWDGMFYRQDIGYRAVAREALLKKS
jgi:phosphoribosylamine--glycine ligase